MQQVGISREQIAEQPVPVFISSDGKTSSVNGPEDLENVDLPGKMAITFKINVASHLPKQAQEADPSDIANANDLQAVNVVDAVLGVHCDQASVAVVIMWIFVLPIALSLRG